MQLQIQRQTITLNNPSYRLQIKQSEYQREYDDLCEDINEYASDGLMPDQIEVEVTPAFWKSLSEHQKARLNGFGVRIVMGEEVIRNE